MYIFVNNVKNVFEKIRKIGAKVYTTIISFPSKRDTHLRIAKEMENKFLAWARLFLGRRGKTHKYPSTTYSRDTNI